MKTIKSSLVLLVLLFSFSSFAQELKINKSDLPPLRSTFYGSVNFILGAVDLGPLGSGGAALEFQAWRNLWIGGYIEGGGTNTSGMFHAGPVFRVRLPFANSPLTWLMTARGGLGAHITQRYSGNSLYSFIQASLAGLEWTINPNMSLTAIIPTPNLLLGSMGTAVSTGLELGFNYWW